MVNKNFKKGTAGNFLCPKLVWRRDGETLLVCAVREGCAGFAFRGWGNGTRGGGRLALASNEVLCVTATRFRVVVCSWACGPWVGTHGYGCGSPTGLGSLIEFLLRRFVVGELHA
jgi:hypothetical protein